MNGRLIVHEAGAGAWNMAVDEALLRSAADSAEWTLRIYRWSDPVLSLGYFQSYADRDLHSASAASDCVRRSTGGGAIVHDLELTYSLACPASDRWSRNNDELYLSVHRVICGSLAEQEIHVDLFPKPDERKENAGDNRHEPFLCFQRRTHGDIVYKNPDDETARENKVCGSAQRRHKNAVLQHGSLILRTSDSAPKIAGLLDLAGRELDENTFLRSLHTGLQDAFDIQLDAAELTAIEIEQAREIQQAKFGSTTWTNKR